MIFRAMNSQANKVAPIKMILIRAKMKYFLTFVTVFNVPMDEFGLMCHLFEPLYSLRHCSFRGKSCKICHIYEVFSVFQTLFCDSHLLGADCIFCCMWLRDFKYSKYRLVVASGSSATLSRLGFFQKLGLVLASGIKSLLRT